MKAVKNTMTTFFVPLPSGDTVGLYVPFPMQRTDFDHLMATLNLWERSLIDNWEERHEAKAEVDCGDADEVMIYATYTVNFFFFHFA